MTGFVNSGFSKCLSGYRIVRFLGETISMEFNICLNLLQSSSCLVKSVDGFLIEICFNHAVVL
ncbi:hypothetical protein OIU79_007188 [Salix purpurea]|uniref:Uncharacterized protein n=1 Tax=Salix purpurea TaxID=77065 RepID=A0A9Q0TX82_SALPP|nr:hypothetical protein OIU79_007188 [Salix purpurea]